jgi:hypothetical protein
VLTPLEFSLLCDARLAREALYDEEKELTPSVVPYFTWSIRAC